jgi:hypothetical protein
MQLRNYIPAQDAYDTFELGGRLFDYSKFYNVEHVKEFLYSYNGWVIENPDKQIIAFLMYSFENGLYYIDFIGSAQKGCGGLLLQKFIDFVDSQNIPSFLHVELENVSEPGTRAKNLIRWYQRNGYCINKPILGPLLPHMLKYTVTMTRKF